MSQSGKVVFLTDDIPSCLTLLWNINSPIVGHMSDWCLFKTHQQYFMEPTMGQWLHPIWNIVCPIMENGKKWVFIDHLPYFIFVILVLGPLLMSCLSLDNIGHTVSYICYKILIFSTLRRKLLGGFKMFLNMPILTSGHI